MKLTELSPMLECSDIHATIEFYTGILGFTLRSNFEHEGVTTWCDMVRDDIAIMFSIPNKQMNYGRSLLTGLYINTDDVDVLWDSLKDKCEVVYPIENFIYGMREFAIKDNNGYVLNFGESIEK